ncbi:hypothetical protein AHMF7605_01540 [Adhaeribacter arboris]|uniref:Uncharacterized protein n=1 Tax=Adhaeribacter arboris TaxID=2072846 RepID=A0A2T2Y9V3_9BACT|nr:hypothetical protein [Adhaeribacter arboris]PSR52295.1 hypothetical protein AHMF7605_01540 [Adhaeribacter arboris]
MWQTKKDSEIYINGNPFLYSIFCFSQNTSIEEKALDFYLKNMYEKGSKLRSTGIFDTHTNPFIGGDLVSDYLNCKKRSAKDTMEENL